MNKKRVGFYAWAGPDTIKMQNLKFFTPKIDKKSLLSTYDYDYLNELKDKFGITDFWAMYSWGFSDQNEADQHKFLIDRLDNFKKLDIKVHAYIQGTNIVMKDLKDVDWYCLDNKNKKINYYRGRYVVCLNNPNFIDYKIKLIEKMIKEDFDAIYMDNIQMGQIALPFEFNKLPFNFTGCNCNYCKKKFLKEYDAEIPLDFEKNLNLTQNYLDFRINSVTNFISKISNVVRANNKEFGTNSFDPKFNIKYIFGTDLEKLISLQDYFLFENHSLNFSGIDNGYINSISSQLIKPVFVVSYRKGIGYEPEYTQKDINNIYSEVNNFNFNSCIKGSEYNTNGIWHNLRINNYVKPVLNNTYFRTNLVKGKKIPYLIKIKLIRKILSNIYNPFFRLYMENFFVRSLLSRFNRLILR